MRSNSYGRWEQTIIIDVEESAACKLGSALGAEPFVKFGVSSRAFLVWKRLTTRPGNDEDVVWDIWIALSHLDGDIDWRIDWRCSDY